jgi:hypothetical protein
MFHPMNDNRDGVPVPVLPLRPAAPAPVFRFHAVPGAERVAVYWPILCDATARAALSACRAVGAGVDSQPAGPETRLVFGNSHVGRAVVTFAAHARLVAAGHAEPIHRA